MGASGNEAAMTSFAEAIAQLSNADAIADFLADDVVVEDWMAPGQTYEGRERVHSETFAPLPGSFPDVRFRVTREIRSGDLLILCGFFEGTFVNDYWGFKATGKQVRWEARDIYRFRDGKVDRIWWGNDTLTVARELGADIPDRRLW